MCFRLPRETAATLSLRRRLLGLRGSLGQIGAARLSGLTTSTSSPGTTLRALLASPLRPGAESA
eukprot:9236321-Alexandrium_andersonii.AAC.1